MAALRRGARYLALQTATALFLLTALTLFSPKTAAAPFSGAAFSGISELDLSAGPPQKEPLLSILYDASTYGELYPCPT